MNINTPFDPANVLALCRLEPSQLAAEILNAAPDDIIGLSRLNDLAGEAYWNKKDLPLSVKILRVGIARGRTLAELATKSDPVIAANILGKVKAMAYNLASFTWPAWDDPGIDITDEQLAAGREAARLNLELAIQLNRPPEKVGLAHWLVGAHALSTKEYSAAATSFKTYQELATTKEHQLLVEGYLAIARLLNGENADQAFDASLQGLKELGTADAKFFAEQLVSVRNYFERVASNR